MVDNAIDRSSQIHQSHSAQTLYDTDFAVWIEHTAELLKQQRFSELDLENLIEEIEALGRSDRREIRSRLIVLLAHLLKFAYQPDRRSRSWTATILEQRRQIRLILADSPSLKRYLSDIFAACYVEAREEAAEETGLELATFPETCPFGETESLERHWWPDLGL
jgi:hypothetical protein